MSTDKGDNREDIFFERCGWTIQLWLFLIFMAASLTLAVWAALGDFWAGGTLLGQLLLLLVLRCRSRLLVRVNDHWLFVGKAKIERRFITSASPLGRNALQKRLGPDADPAAYLATRFWIHTGVLIQIDDPQDRTPYWIVSSKKPSLLTEALLSTF